MYTTKLDPEQISALTDKLLIARKNNLKQVLEIEHRLETVLEIDGVEYLNDSKATDVTATMYSLVCMDRPVVWLLSCVVGYEDFSELIPLVRDKVKAIFYAGNVNDLLVEDMINDVDLILQCGSMEEMVKEAQDYAEAGDTVLFSPCTPSDDLYGTYRRRGEEFRKCVRAL
jgi:UDP-N-acetylmuramoylalanine--D-glutamate ligase